MHAHLNCQPVQLPKMIKTQRLKDEQIILCCYTTGVIWLIKLYKTPTQHKILFDMVFWVAQQHTKSCGESAFNFISSINIITYLLYPNGDQESFFH